MKKSPAEIAGDFCFHDSVLMNQCVQFITMLYSAPTALAALSLPPVETLPFRESRRSTELRILSRNCSTEILGSFAIINAATPATSGVAIEVPDASRNCAPNHVLRISTPGAAM